MITGASCFRNFIPVKQDAKAFAKHFTVYNYDRRARGDSGNESADKPYDINRELEDIEALIDAAGGEAILYGHSSGAVLALEATLKLGKKVSKLYIYDAPYVADETEKVSYKKLGDTVNSLLREKKNAAAMKTFLGGIGMPKLFIALLSIFPGWKTMKNLAPTLAFDIALTEILPPLERLARIDCPTVVMWGEKSPQGIHTVGQSIASAIPGARSFVVEGQDHMVSVHKLLSAMKQVE